MGIMGYYVTSLVLGIVYPIHVCLQMRFYMLHSFATVLEKRANHPYTSVCNTAVTTSVDVLSGTGGESVHDFHH